MSKAELQNWLFQNPGFQAKLHKLVIDSVSNQFPYLLRNIEHVATHDWPYLLLCASLLAQSDKSYCQDSALRIAQFCLESSDLNNLNKDAAAVVLDTLANNLSLRLAQERNLLKENVADRLPFPLVQDWIKRSIENSITLNDARSITVNRFQRIFWNSVHKEGWISISAPTSVGKSYILGLWLVDYLSRSQIKTIVYLVPTRALIHQVHNDIEKFLSDYGVRNVLITTLPMRSSLNSSKSNILVFTQERFHILLGESETNLKINLLIVDEAQKVGDGYRGILLQQAIETAVQKNPQCRVVFASPMTENPGILLDDSRSDVLRIPLLREDTVVNQNLIWVSQISRNPMIWDVELIYDAKPIKIGEIVLKYRPSPVSKRLPFVAFTLGNINGGNLIYANGAADAEIVAKQIYALLWNEKPIPNDYIEELTELIHKTIHPKYSLASILSRGVAFHYGNMPLLIRTEIERLFRANVIKYLVCTSTLIEGVNMPCQSIFLRGPTKGKGKPMTSGDFWNLAGRAGRWGKEFQGNVVCVDARRTDVWRNGAPRGKANFQIKRTTDDVLANAEDLLEFIKNGSPREKAKKNPNLEYALSYLLSCHILNGDISQCLWSWKSCQAAGYLNCSVDAGISTFKNYFK